MSEAFTFFWNGPFSQWFPSPFTLDDVAYNTAEQFMMAEKAKLFGDEPTRALILGAAHPAEQKALGRQVANFDENRWKTHARDIVYRGNRAKFTTHPDLLAKLFATEGTMLVEASPYDRLWGIGRSEKDPRSRNQSTWNGANWLGETLTRVRDDLLSARCGERID